MKHTHEKYSMRWRNARTTNSKTKRTLQNQCKFSIHWKFQICTCLQKEIMSLEHREEFWHAKWSEEHVGTQNCRAAHAKWVENCAIDFNLF